MGRLRSEVARELVRDIGREEKPKPPSAILTAMQKMGDGIMGFGGADPGTDDGDVELALEREGFDVLEHQRQWAAMKQVHGDLKKRLALAELERDALRGAVVNRENIRGYLAATLQTDAIQTMVTMKGKEYADCFMSFLDWDRLRRFVVESGLSVGGARGGGDAGEPTDTGLSKRQLLENAQALNAIKRRYAEMLEDKQEEVDTARLDCAKLEKEVEYLEERLQALDARDDALQRERQAALSRTAGVFKAAAVFLGATTTQKSSRQNARGLADAKAAVDLLRNELKEARSLADCLKDDLAAARSELAQAQKELMMAVSDNTRDQDQDLIAREKEAREAEELRQLRAEVQGLRAQLKQQQQQQGGGAPTSPAGASNSGASGAIPDALAALRAQHFAEFHAEFTSLLADALAPMQRAATGLADQLAARRTDLEGQYRQFKTHALEEDLKIVAATGAGGPLDATADSPVTFVPVLALPATVKRTPSEKALNLKSVGKTGSLSGGGPAAGAGGGQVATPSEAHLTPGDPAVDPSASGGTAGGGGGGGTSAPATPRSLNASPRALANGGKGVRRRSRSQRRGSFVGKDAKDVQEKEKDTAGNKTDKAADKDEKEKEKEKGKEKDKDKAGTHPAAKEKDRDPSTATAAAAAATGAAAAAKGRDKPGDAPKERGTAAAAKDGKGAKGDKRRAAAQDAAAEKAGEERERDGQAAAAADGGDVAAHPARADYERLQAAALARAKETDKALGALGAATRNCVAKLTRDAPAAVGSPVEAGAAPAQRVASDRHPATPLSTAGTVPAEVQPPRSAFATPLAPPSRGNTFASAQRADAVEGELATPGLVLQTPLSFRSTPGVASDAGGHAAAGDADVRASVAKLMSTLTACISRMQEDGADLAEWMKAGGELVLRAEKDAQVRALQQQVQQLRALQQQLQQQLREAQQQQQPATPRTPLTLRKKRSSTLRRQSSLARGGGHNDARERSDATAAAAAIYDVPVPITPVFPDTEDKAVQTGADIDAVAALDDALARLQALAEDLAAAQEARAVLEKDSAATAAARDTAVADAAASAAEVTRLKAALEDANQAIPPPPPEKKSIGVATRPVDVKTHAVQAVKKAGAAGTQTKPPAAVLAAHSKAVQTGLEVRDMDDILSAADAWETYAKTERRSRWVQTEPVSMLAAGVAGDGGGVVNGGAAGTPTLLGATPRRQLRYDDIPFATSFGVDADANHDPHGFGLGGMGYSAPSGGMSVPCMRPRVEVSKADVRETRAQVRRTRQQQQGSHTSTPGTGTAGTTTDTSGVDAAGESPPRVVRTSSGPHLFRSSSGLADESFGRDKDGRGVPLQGTPLMKDLHPAGGAAAPALRGPPAGVLGSSVAGYAGQDHTVTARWRAATSRSPSPDRSPCGSPRADGAPIERNPGVGVDHASPERRARRIAAAAVDADKPAGAAMPSPRKMESVAFTIVEDTDIASHHISLATMPYKIAMVPQISSAELCAMVGAPQGASPMPAPKAQQKKMYKAQRTAALKSICVTTQGMPLRDPHGQPNPLPAFHPSGVMARPTSAPLSRPKPPTQIAISQAPLVRKTPGSRDAPSVGRTQRFHVTACG